MVDSTMFVALWVLIAVAGFVCWAEWQAIFDPKTHKKP